MPKPYTPNDKWSQKAADEGYRARSVYKLMELDERFHLLKKGMTVLDLGAAPGSWLQYAAEKVGPSGTVIGIDLTPIEPIADNVITKEIDITDEGAVTTALHGIPQVDLILSDLAPKTSGVKDVDQWRSIELSEAVLKIAKRVLVSNGTCVMKILQGADYDEFLKKTKEEWKNVKPFTAEASRDRSREIYLVLTRP